LVDRDSEKALDSQHIISASSFCEKYTGCIMVQQRVKKRKMVKGFFSTKVHI
jgi:hypothetical protein